MITFRCTLCGSDNIVRDAWAQWDPDAQKWELSATFDHFVCEGECGGEETAVEEVEYNPEEVDE